MVRIQSFSIFFLPNALFYLSLQLACLIYLLYRVHRDGVILQEKSTGTAPCEHFKLRAKLIRPPKVRGDQKQPFVSPNVSVGQQLSQERHTSTVRHMEGFYCPLSVGLSFFL